MCLPIWVQHDSVVVKRRSLIKIPQRTRTDQRKKQPVEFPYNCRYFPHGFAALVFFTLRVLHHGASWVVLPIGCRCGSFIFLVSLMPTNRGRHRVNILQSIKSCICDSFQHRVNLPFFEYNQSRDVLRRNLQLHRQTFAVVDIGSDVFCVCVSGHCLHEMKSIAPTRMRKFRIKVQHHWFNCGGQDLVKLRDCANDVAHDFHTSEIKSRFYVYLRCFYESLTTVQRLGRLRTEMCYYWMLLRCIYNFSAPNYGAQLTFLYFSLQWVVWLWLQIDFPVLRISP